MSTMNNSILPRDMGTTGLINWVMSKPAGRKRALCRATACRIMATRVGVKALAVFKRQTFEA